MREISVGVLTVDNKCALSDDVDEVGLYLRLMIRAGIVGDTCKDVKTFSVEEDAGKIEEKLKKWVDEYKISIILTVGGVGEAHQNVAVKATLSIADKEVHGIIRLLRQFSEDVTCVLRRESVIVNLPDNAVVSRRCLRSIAHSIFQIAFLFLPWEMRLEYNIATQSGVKPVTSEIFFQYIEERSVYMRKVSAMETNNAVGFVLAEDIVPSGEIPPFDISSVDGFAILLSDGYRERELINGTNAEERPGGFRVTPGTCVRIRRGDAIPNGADAVIEEVNSRQTESVIQVETGLNHLYDNIIRRGSLNFNLRKGTSLSDRLIHRINESGINTVKVYKKPTIAITSVFPNFGTRFSMSIMEFKGFECRNFGEVCDDGNLWYTVLTEAFKVADVIVTIGVKPENSVLSVLRSDFQGNIFCNDREEVYLSGISFKKEQKLWLGFMQSSSNLFNMFLFPALNCIKGKHYQEPCITETENMPTDHVVQPFERGNSSGGVSEAQTRTTNEEEEPDTTGRAGEIVTREGGTNTNQRRRRRRSRPNVYIIYSQ